jgi:surface polysaccharide O-acyltransferase-like enzyme
MAVPTPPAKPAERYVFLDVCRFAAAVAVAWEHTPTSPALVGSRYFGTFAVPFFVIVSIFLMFEGQRRGPRRPLGKQAVSRLGRIVPPLVAWSVIYVLARVLKSRALHKAPLVPGFFDFIGGSANHLWFLPFVLIVSLLLLPAARALSGAGRAVRWALAVVCVVAAGIVASVPHYDFYAAIEDQRVAFFVDRSVAASPAVFLGLAAALIYPCLPARGVRYGLLASLGLASCVACLVVGYRTGGAWVGWENAAGLGFFVFALAPWEWPGVARAAGLGRVAYGFYLAHMSPIQGLQVAAAWLRAPASAGADVTIYVLTVVCTLGLVYLLSRSRRTRWLMP